MPPAIALAAPAIMGAGASAAGGKKGGGTAKKAANQQFQLQKQAFDTGMGAWQPAKDYYSALLSGDPTKMAEATGPTRDVLRGASAANARQLALTMPAGGEANAAQATNAQDTYNQVARLTAGVQPGAASALAGLAAMPMQLGAPNVGAGLGYNLQSGLSTGESKGAFGQGLGRIAAGGKRPGAGKQGKGGGTPSTFPPMTSGLPGA